MKILLAVIISFAFYPAGKEPEIKYEIGYNDAIRLYTNDSGNLVIKLGKDSSVIRVHKDFTDTILGIAPKDLKSIIMADCIEYTSSEDESPGIVKYDQLQECLYSVKKHSRDYKYTLFKTCGSKSVSYELFKDKTAPFDLEWGAMDIDKDGKQEIILNYYYAGGGGSGYNNFITICQ